MKIEEVSAVVVDAAFHLHRDLGPGLLESVYESVLARMLERCGLRVERQKAVSFDFDGIHFDEGLRVDLLVEGCLVVELKSVETLAPVHAKQLLTYLRLLHLPIGLLINFGASTFKEGIKRVVNNHKDFAASRLRVRPKRSKRPRPVTSKLTSCLPFPARHDEIRRKSAERRAVDMGIAGHQIAFAHCVPPVFDACAPLQPDGISHLFIHHHL